MSLTKRPFVIIGLLAIVIAALAFAFSDNKLVRRMPVQPASATSTPAPVVPRALSPLPVRALTPDLKRLRARAMETVAKTRGLAWKSEVKMTTLSGWEYGTRTGEVTEIFGGDDLSAIGRLAAAGGVLPQDVDLGALAASFTAVSASATYSPFDKQILLVERGGKSESLMTHEMTHAMQDQHFDLERLLLRRPYSFDKAEAVFAVIEGDAVSVQRRFEQGAAWERVPLTQIGQREDERFATYRTQIGAFFPPLLLETFIFRYRDGVRFVEAVRRRDGQIGVDNLFRNPPASSEQILHPEKYFAGEQPRPATIDERMLGALGWRQTTSTPLGEIGIRGVLLAGASAKDAAKAAAGWGGDTAYLFESSEAGKSLFAWQTAWDTHTDADEFFAAYNKLLETGRGANRMGEQSASEAKSMMWREGSTVTFIEQRGGYVRVLRGTEEDVRRAAESLAS